MNIQEAKEEIKKTVRAYTARTKVGTFRIPVPRQRPVLLIGPPGIGKTAIMEQIARECSIGLVAYTMTHELDFVVTSDEVLAYYKDSMPMKDLREILPADLQQQLGSALYTATDSEGRQSSIAVDMTGSRFVAGTGADADPRVEHTYYLFVPESAPHTEQIVSFLRYAFRLE